MPRPPLQIHRKIPKQRRSREMVEAILEAAARVFVEAGLDEATTNAIAHRAGVSIGSLYQYFADKESLVRALLLRHVQRAEALRPAAISGNVRPPLAERLGIAVRWLLDVHAQDPELHETLTLLAPRVLGSDAIRAFERFHQNTLRAILERYRDELGDRDLTIASFILARVMESLTHGAVTHRPELLGGEELAAEITDLLVKYLEISPESQRTTAERTHFK